MPLTELVKTFATSKHRVFADRVDDWTLAEQLLRGGRKVREHLVPFSWEKSDTEHFERRKKTASYINFPEMMASKFVGYLASEAPTPEQGYDFGALGTVRGEDAITDELTPAEMLWYNCDLQGTGLPLFMTEAHKRAVATGHRWIVVDMTAEAPTSVAEEQAGLRPYLAEYSPTRVPNWRYDSGRLIALVTRSAVDVLVSAEGEYAAEPETRLTLYIASGATAAAFGDEAVAHGLWVVLDEEGKVTTDSAGNERMGTLEATGGDIPAVPLFYATDEEDFSVSGTEDVGATALSYMNLSSAGDNDILASCSRLLLLFNVATTVFNDAMDVKEDGGRIVPFGPSPTLGGGGAPSWYDSASSSTGESVERALERKAREADRIASDELRTSLAASGEARKVEFFGTKAPRLSTMAYHRERAENEILRFAALRWGVADDAAVAWPKRFDVEDTVDDWVAVFGAAARMQADSPTLTALGIERILRSKNVALDKATWTKISAEIAAAAAARAQAGDDLSTLPDDL